MRFRSYLSTTVQILNSYGGEVPFPGFIRTFFRSNKKYGATDRKWITQLCYSFFRLGKSNLHLPVQERILLGWLMAANGPDALLEALKPEWMELASSGLSVKWEKLSPDPSIKSVLPQNLEWSGGLDTEAFAASLFVQPDLFVRIRPGMEDLVFLKLKNAGLDYRVIGNDCLAFPNGTKLDNLFEIDREIVIQDYSSQRVAEFFPDLQWAHTSDKPGKGIKSVYDCCAGSGGKSILLYDKLNPVSLTVSDIRESILFNLHKRFRMAGISDYESFVANLGAPWAGGFVDKNDPGRKTTGKPLAGRFQMVLADVPCTGSGTWGRNPEYLYFFRPGETGSYVTRQKAIVENIIPALQPGGFLLYVTCSVFRMENEGLVEMIRNRLGLELIKSGLIAGYPFKADSLFAALFILPR